ncbi:MAG: AlpA family phage regulatory protein [Acidobacteria bacterium]|nr:AlpA family phage regulatory protein [Acidobacteriota bacterium]
MDGIQTEDRLLTRAEVERRVSLGRSSLYRMMRMTPPAFPLPVRVGPRAVRWPSSEIEAWIADRPRSLGDGSA